MITFGLVHMKYTRCTLHVTLLVHIKYTVCTLHVTLLVHINYTVCKLHVTDDPNNHNWDCRQGPYYYRTYPSRLCFPDIWSFCCDLILLISAECIAVQVSLQFFQPHSAWVRAVHGELGLQNCSRVCYCNICRYCYNTFL